MTNTSPNTPSKAEAKKAGNQLYKVLIEVMPVAIFLYLYDATVPESVFTATKGFMVAIIASIIASKIIYKKIGIILWVSAAMVVIMGGATLYFEDDFFFKIKPTIMNSFFAIALIGGYFAGKPLIKYLLEASFPDVPHEVWLKLSFRFGLFYIFLAVLNEITWRNFSTEIWMSAKLWVVMPVNMLFMLTQMPLLMKYLTIEEK